MVVRNNKVHHCRGGGISFDQSDHLLIEWNQVYRNALHDVEQHSGISVYQSQRRGGDDSQNLTAPSGNNQLYPGKILVENNLCFSNGGQGIHNVNVYNNILVARNGKRANLQFERGSVWWDYNVLFNGPSRGANNRSHTIFSNPRLRFDEFPKPGDGSQCGPDAPEYVPAGC